MAKTVGEAALGALTIATGSSERSIERSSSNAHLTESLRLWRAMLPSRSRDEVSGELMLRGYQMMLGHLSVAQIDTLTRMILNECKFFPTVAEVNAIMGRESYSNPFYVAARQVELNELGYTAPQRATRRIASNDQRRALTNQGDQQ